MIDIKFDFLADFDFNLFNFIKIFLLTGGEVSLPPRQFEKRIPLYKYRVKNWAKCF